MNAASSRTIVLQLQSLRNGSRSIQHSYPKRSMVTATLSNASSTYTYSTSIINSNSTAFSNKQNGYGRHSNHLRRNNNAMSVKWRGFSSAKRDFYEVLGVGKNADKAEIKKAYFKLAKEFHPDRNKDNPEAADKFKEATAAYEVLSDPKQKELYDSYGHSGVDPNFQAGQGFGDGFAGFDFGNAAGGNFHFHSNSGSNQDIEDLFEAFFGGGGRSRRPRGPRRGADLQMRVNLSFQEAVFGSSKDLNLRYHVVENGKQVLKSREVSVETPAGIDTGMNLRLQGQGAEGDPGAPRGNLMVQVIVEEDDYFHRDGFDVHTEAPISFVQAVLGGHVDVRTLNGVVEMKIPKGSQPDAKLLLRGKGIPRLHGNGGRGNHIVHLKLEIPKKLSPRQEELLREFDEETRACGGGISGRIAKAAKSTFEKFFGNGEHKSEKEKDPPKQSDKNPDTKSEQDKARQKDDNDEDEFQKRAAV